MQLGINNRNKIFQRQYTKLHELAGQVQLILQSLKNFFFLKYLFIPNCMRIIMWLLVNNTLENMLFKSSTNCFFSQAPMCLVFQYLLTLLIAVYINLWKCSCDLSKCLENVKLPTAVFRRLPVDFDHLWNMSWVSSYALQTVVS